MPKRIEVEESSLNTKKGSIRVLTKATLGKTRVGIDMELVDNPYVVANRLLAPLGSKTMAEIMGSKYYLVSTDFIYLGDKEKKTTISNIKSYTKRTTHFIPRVHVAWYVPRNENIFDCIERGCAVLGYLGIGPNVPVGKNIVLRMLGRHTEGGVLTNVYSHGSTVIFSRPFLKALREPLQRLDPTKLKPEDMITAAAIKSTKLVSDYKKAIMAHVLTSILGHNIPLNIPTYKADFDISHYRDSYYIRKEMEQMVPIKSLLPFHLGYADESLWIGLPCKDDSLCHAVRLAIRFIGPQVAAKGSLNYYKLLIEEFRKNSLSYYEHSKKLALKHGIKIVPPPREFNNFVRSLKNIKTMGKMLYDAFWAAKEESDKQVRKFMEKFS